MNETNILADVPVPEVNETFKAMFMKQIQLQSRLQQLPPGNRDFKYIAGKNIYWGHCIRAEVEELLEWVSKQEDPTWVKEMQMEAIDIIHFTFNMAIELALELEFIEAIEAQYEHYTWEIDTSRIHAATLILGRSIITLINALPWKTWKTYTDIKVDTRELNRLYADVLRAALILCNATGLDKQGIINMYYAKNKVNHERQDNGY